MKVPLNLTAFRQQAKFFGEACAAYSNGAALSCFLELGCGQGQSSADSNRSSTECLSRVRELTLLAVLPCCLVFMPFPVILQGWALET